MYNQYYKSLYLTLGHFFNYPKCCVEYFISTDDHEYFFKSKHILNGSGFVPCPCCFEKTKSYNKQELLIWLGRDPFKKTSVAICLERTKNTSFIGLAHKFDLDIDFYRNRLLSRYKI